MKSKGKARLTSTAISPDGLGNELMKWLEKERADLPANPFVCYVLQDYSPLLIRNG